MHDSGPGPGADGALHRGTVTHSGPGWPGHRVPYRDPQLSGCHSRLGCSVLRLPHAPAVPGPAGSHHDGHHDQPEYSVRRPSSAPENLKPASGPSWKSDVRFIVCIGS
eukprot:2445036-Rhodomonas_salina.1